MSDHVKSARTLRGERINAWWRCTWPNKYERYVAMAVIVGSVGACWGAAGGWIMNAILD